MLHHAIWPFHQAALVATGPWVSGAQIGTFGQTKPWHTQTTTSWTDSEPRREIGGHDSPDRPWALDEGGGSGDLGEAEMTVRTRCLVCIGYNL
jgi:hypothetical protein